MTKPRIEKLGALTLAELHGPHSELSRADVAATLRTALEAVGLGVSAEPLADWLLPRLQAYELHQYGVRTRGQPAAAIEWLRQALSDVPRALNDGRLRQLPLRWVAPSVWLASYRVGEPFERMVDGRNLQAIARVLATACDYLTNEPTLRRPSSLERDLLLLDVRTWLRAAGASATQADECAQRVLIAFRVQCPPLDSMPRALARANKARRVQRGSSGQ